MTKIVLITGGKGSGRTQVAEALKQYKQTLRERVTLLDDELHVTPEMLRQTIRVTPEHIDQVLIVALEVKPRWSTDADLKPSCHIHCEKS